MTIEINQVRYQHETDIRIRFCETDANQHVSQASYAIYFEEARIAFLESMADPAFRWWTNDHTLVLAQQCLIYRKPAFFRQTLTVLSGVQRIGRSSLDLVHVAVLREDRNAVIAESTSTVVLIDSRTNRSLPWPDNFRTQVGIALA